MKKYQMESKAEHRADWSIMVLKGARAFQHKQHAQGAQEKIQYLWYTLWYQKAEAEMYGLSAWCSLV